MNEEQLWTHLVDDLPTAGAIMLAWFLFARKHSEGLAAIHRRIDQFLTQLIEVLKDRERH